MKRAFGAVLDGLRRILISDIGRDEKLQIICEFIQDRVPGCDWVGFYLVDPEDERFLLLGPFAGEPTEHTRIPVGIGICGQAAERRETVVVDDVSMEKNYIACSLAVQSEIVVPILVEERVAGELDIDSHHPAHFTAEHRQLFEAICRQLTALFAEPTQRSRC